MTATTGKAGAVYDRGYRPYDGPRGGRSAARFALYKASIRRALGLRRSWRQKIAPFVLLAIVTVPAIVNVGIAYLTRNQIGRRIEFITYREYVGVSSALLVFVALTAPDLLCPERRQRVLPLLFARPLTGVDYVIAKVGALFSILFLFSFLPQVVLFLGQAFVNDDVLGYMGDNIDVVWQVPLSVALLSLFYAVVGLAIASLSPRRIVAGASFLGLFLVSSVTSGILVGELRRRDPGSPAALISVLRLPLYLRDLVFLGDIDPLSPLRRVDSAALYVAVLYTAVLLLAFVVLLRRYRWTER